jgi:hypothetical protein
MVMVDSSCALSSFGIQVALNGFFASVNISPDEYFVFHVLGDTFILLNSDAHNADLKRLISDGCPMFPYSRDYAGDSKYWLKDFKRPVFQQSGSFPRRFSAYKLCLHGNSLSPSSPCGSLDGNGNPILSSFVTTQLALWGIVSPPKDVDGSSFTISAPSIINRYEYGFVLGSIHQLNIVTDSWLSTLLLRMLFSEMKDLHPSFMLRVNGHDTNSEWVAFRAAKKENAAKLRGGGRGGRELMYQPHHPIEKVVVNNTTVDPNAPESPAQAEQRRIAEAAWQTMREEKMKEYNAQFPPLSTSSC